MSTLGTSIQSAAAAVADGIVVVSEMYVVYSDTPRYTFSSVTNLVCCCYSHGEHFIIARRLQAVDAICNLACVDNFSNFAGRRN